MRYKTIRDKMIKRIAKRNMGTAVGKNDVKTVGKLLKKYGYHSFSDMDLLYEAVQKLNFEMVRSLIENGWDINQIDDNEENVMFDIIEFDENDQIKMYLFEKGIDVHQIACDGETLIMKAAYYDEYELGELFVSRGVSLVKENDEGETVFDVLDEENKSKWIDMFMKNQHHLDPESLKLVKRKRLELLF